MTTPPRDDESSSTCSSSSRLAPECAVDLLARQMLPREYLYEGDRLPLESVGLIVGAPRAGKGFWSTAVAVSVAAGVEIAEGWRPVRARPVVMVAAEDTNRRLRERIDALRRGYGIDREELRGLHVIVRPNPPLRLEHRGDVDELLRAIKPIEPGLVVVDGLRRVTSADECDSTAMAVPLAALERVRDVTSAALHVIHHSTIAGRLGVYQARGSSAIAAHVDYQIAVNRTSDTIALAADYDRDGDGWSATLRLERSEDGSARYVAVEAAAPARSPSRGQNTYGRVVAAMSVDKDLSVAEIARRASLPATTVRSVISRMPPGSVVCRSEGRRTMYRVVRVSIRSSMRDDDKILRVGSSSSCPQTPLTPVDDPEERAAIQAEGGGTP